MDDADHVRPPTRQAGQTNRFRSNARAWEREPWVCQRLLHELNACRQDALSAAQQEPPEALFRQARFKVFRQERRRTDEVAKNDRPASFSQGVQRAPANPQMASGEHAAR